MAWTRVTVGGQPRVGGEGWSCVCVRCCSRAQIIPAKRIASHARRCTGLASIPAPVHVQNWNSTSGCAIVENKSINPYGRPLTGSTPLLPRQKSCHIFSVLLCRPKIWVGRSRNPIVSTISDVNAVGLAMAPLYWRIEYMPLR